MPHQRRTAHVFPPANAAFTASSKPRTLPLFLGGVSLGIFFQQERRDVAAGHGEERLVCEQLDAAGGIEDVGNVDLLPLAL